jgi:hypothetical protein
MAAEDLNDMDRRMIAGREYHHSLQRLGFFPQAVFWAHVGHVEPTRMELCVVTSWADNIGPKAVYDLLFEAYDESATPREIDPFIVSIFSPRSQVAADLFNAVGMVKSDNHKYDPRGAMIVLGMFDYMTIYPWVIFARETKSTRFDDARRFRAFQANVERLAA